MCSLGAPLGLKWFLGTCLLHSLSSFKPFLKFPFLVKPVVMLWFIDRNTYLGASRWFSRLSAQLLIWAQVMTSRSWAQAPWQAPCPAGSLLLSLSPPLPLPLPLLTHTLTLSLKYFFKIRNKKLFFKNRVILYYFGVIVISQNRRTSEFLPSAYYSPIEKDN